MTTPKLTYFDARGRAAVCRLVFAQAGAEYEDVRVSMEEWAKVKEDRTRFPMACLPVLDIDGQTMIMSTTMARYLARKYGLFGHDEKEMTLVDMMTDLCTDMLNEMFDLMFEKDAARKEEMTEKFKKKSDTYMANFQERLEKNGDGKGFLVGNSVTLADLALFNLLEQLSKHFADILTKNAPLQAYFERMKSQPKIAAWLEKRPKGEMDV